MTRRPLNDAVRFGVLGCADIAVRRVLPVLTAVPDTELVAVASRSPERARAVVERFGGEPVHGYAGLLERADVDAVYVPLPAALHAEWAERALRAGKHVLAEKPLTTDPAATDRLFTLAGRLGSVLAENFLFLHHTQYTRVGALLAEGAIGAPLHLSASFTVPPRPDGDIRLSPELGGGALLDMGVYPLRLAVELLGTDLEVTGAALRHDRALGVDLGGAVLLRRVHDGVTAQLTFGMEHRYTACWELLGSAGRLTLAHGAWSPPAEHVPVLRLDAGDGVRELRLSPHDQVRTAVIRFARAVRTGRPTTDGQAERTLTRLVTEIRRSARVTEL